MSRAPTGMGGDLRLRAVLRAVVDDHHLEVVGRLMTQGLKGLLDEGSAVVGGDHHGHRPRTLVPHAVHHFPS